MLTSKLLNLVCNFKCLITEKREKIKTEGLIHIFFYGRLYSSVKWRIFILLWKWANSRMRDTNNLKLRFEINLNQHYFMIFLLCPILLEKNMHQHKWLLGLGLVLNITPTVLLHSLGLINMIETYICYLY